MEGALVISKDGLRLDLCSPGTYYRGTRFDWCGVFEAISWNGQEMSGQWFDSIDPYRHDNLSGCSEEFAPIWIDDKHCVKIGVGILYVPEGAESYDRFNPYECIDMGEMTVEAHHDSVTFRHVLSGWYVYEKTITITGGKGFRIAHSLRWTCSYPEKTDCYNHNFFTFGKAVVGPSRLITFDSDIRGNWRPDSVKGYMEGKRLAFSQEMEAGEKCFIGDLEMTGDQSRGYSFSVQEGSIRVDVKCNAPMDHAVFWSNHRVACVEPYVNLELNPSRVNHWSIDYIFSLYLAEQTSSKC